MSAVLPAASLPAEELARLRALWQSFRDRWPIETLRTMTLEQYTDLERKDAFVYWVEMKVDDIGSIRGSNAFKWGIYRRGSSAAKSSSGPYAYSTNYGWWSYLGKTEAEAFASTRSKVIAVAEQAAAGRFDEIEKIALSLLYKWKLAFLYQPMKTGIVLPIFADKPVHRITPRTSAAPGYPGVNAIGRCARSTRRSTTSSISAIAFGRSSRSPPLRRYLVPRTSMRAWESEPRQTRDPRVGT